jgi:hypothetical protein
LYDGRSHVCEEIALFVAIRDPHTLEHVFESDVDVQIARIRMEVQERARVSRKVTAPAFLQLWELAQLTQQFLQAIEVLLVRMPHVPSMAPGAGATQEGAFLQLVTLVATRP